MIDNYIQLNKNNVIRLGIRDSEGNDTGEYLEFDLEDIELPLRYQDMIERDKKATQNVRNQLMIIDKKQDVKGKKLLSKNQEDKLRILNDYFKEEEEILNMFLGENGVKKLLNGQKLGWTSLQYVGEIIDTQIKPHLNVNMEDITKKVKEKYGNLVKNSNEVLKDE